MNRYIDADKLWNDRPSPPRGQSQDYDKGFWDCIFRFSELIRKSINNSTVDVVEVVRCKDCKFAERYCGNTFDCRCPYAPWANDEYSIPCEADNFCSYGERRTK